VLFNSLAFPVFFAAVLALVYARPRRSQNLVLLLASWAFYGFWDWRFLSLLWLSTAVDFVAAQRIEATEDPEQRRRWLCVSVGVNLGVLGLFKYADFFISSAVQLADQLGASLVAPSLHWVLPVGISFYTFQTMSYTIDVYRRQQAAERDPLSFALFVAFFPQLVAGPIERAGHLLPQLHRPRSVGSHDLWAGLRWMWLGFWLKIFVADPLALVVDPVYNNPGAPEPWAVVLATWAFAWQLFGDFAGYSAIAIGAARLLGFRLRRNFLQPYLTTGARDFWREWHISLSIWLRDYLYVPLGGNRFGARATARNLWLTMLLGGLWHGAAWTYVAWGAWHGLLLTAQRALPSRVRLPRFVGVFLWFQLVCVGWLLFRAPSIADAGRIGASLLGPWSAPSVEARHMAAKLVLHAGPALLWQSYERRTGEATPEVAGRWWVGAVVAVAMGYSMLWFGEFGGREFVYFAF